MYIWEEPLPGWGPAYKKTGFIPLFGSDQWSGDKPGELNTKLSEHEQAQHRNNKEYPRKLRWLYNTLNHS